MRKIFLADITVGYIKQKEIRVPPNNGHIFLQALTPPRLVYCPSEVSRRKRGMPHNTRNNR